MCAGQSLNHLVEERKSGHRTLWREMSVANERPLVAELGPIIHGPCPHLAMN
jgi:hypothetical protein